MRLSSSHVFWPNSAAQRSPSASHAMPWGLRCPYDQVKLSNGLPGGNYGWPVVEGLAGDPRFIDPVQQWSTSEASPSGLAILGDTLFLAALRGERLWTIAPATAGGALTATPWFVGELGRLRDVTAGPDGELWFISNNTDGRGSPSPGDDRLYRVRLAPAG